MRIRYELLLATAVAFTLCLALPAEAAKKKKRGAAPGAYSTSYAAAPGTWGYGSGPVYNGQDYIGQDPDPNIRAYIMKDLGIRYGGAF